MTKEEMMDYVINKYGHEAVETIQFCHAVELMEMQIKALKEELEWEFHNYYE